jgi:hypothetical protein
VGEVSTVLRTAAARSQKMATFRSNYTLKIISADTIMIMTNWNIIKQSKREES